MESRSLLVSDVDGTLLGDDAALERFADWYLGQRDWLALAYASGRFCDSIRQSVWDTSLPEPDAIIGGVGTEICIGRSDESLESWQRTFRGWSHQLVGQALSTFSGLELQPARFQSRYKVSYYATDLSRHSLAALQKKLDQRSLGVKIILAGEII